MLRALGLAVSDLRNGRILAILLQALAISVVVFVIIAGLFVWLLSGIDPCRLIGMDSCELDTGAGTVGAVALTLLAAWFLFPAVAIGVLTTFTDRIASAVEERHYPAAAAEARPIGIGRGAAMGLKSAGRLILFNLVALPFYLLLLVTGIGPFILFVAVNGIAFGRDVAELAAARHGDPGSRRAWLKRTRWQQHWIGLAVSILFLVPFANLLAPVIGTAAGIHLFNGSFWRSGAPAADR
ncbi:MAG TPA: EI24 domain-containing protein [Sphingomicrobium sp.]